MSDPLRSCPALFTVLQSSSLWIKTQILLCPQGPEPPALTIYPPPTLLQPHEPPSCSSKRLGLVLPQDLCICSTLHWECSSPSSVHCSLTRLPGETSSDLSKWSTCPYCLLHMDVDTHICTHMSPFSYCMFFDTF